jgi:periplasmic protein TonB
MVHKLFFLVTTRIFIIFIFLFSSCKAPEWPSLNYIKKFKYEEVKGNLIEIPDDSENCKIKDRFPMYPGGLNGINKMIRDNTVYPEEARKNHIKGTVMVSYIVETNGYIGEIEIKKGVNPLLDNEAIRIIKCMKRWIPGICNGELVKVRYLQPLKFSLK